MNTKMVSLFTIKDEFIEVPVDADYLTVHRRLRPSSLLANQMNSAELNAVVGAKRLPIFTYRELWDADWPFLNEPKSRPYNELAIAVEPELVKLICMPLRSQLELTESRLEKAREAYHKTELELLTLKRQIEQWWEQPWYRRVWLALRAG